MGELNTQKRKMEVIVKNLQTKISLQIPQIIKLIKAILKFKGIGKGCLSIVFVTNQHIKSINKKFLKRNHVTDVLAFGFNEVGSKKQIKGHPQTNRCNADIIISAEMALQNAKKFKTSLDDEIILYMIHGILHVLGFDDHDARDIKKIRREEQRIFEYLRSTVKKLELTNDS